VSNQVVTTAGALDVAWFDETLARAGVLGDAHVVDVATEPIGGGLMARMVRARLTYDGPTDAPSAIIVKFPTDDPGSLGVAQSMGLYQLEVGFYRDVAPLLPDLHAPRCYLAEHDGHSGTFTLVLEDLSLTSRPGDVLQESSLDDCAAALTELVALQAPLWSSPALEEIAWLADRTRTLAVFDQLPLGLTVFLDRFGDKLDPDHVTLFEKVLPKAGEWVRSWVAPTVVQHGDFRPDNLMYGAVPGAARATVIDFQTVRSGPPGQDPAYFLASSLSTASRREAERDLVRDYHQRLLAAGVDGFDFDACWAAYREGALYGVFLYVGMAGSVESTERGDQLIVEQIGRYAAMALDLDAPRAGGLA